MSYDLEVEAGINPFLLLLVMLFFTAMERQLEHRTYTDVIIVFLTLQGTENIFSCLMLLHFLQYLTFILKLL